MKENVQWTVSDYASEATLQRIGNARRLTRIYAGIPYEEKKERRIVLQELLGAMGKNVEIDTPFHCDYGKNIFLADNVIIGMNVTIVDDAPVTIGREVLIASNVQLYAATHAVEPGDRILRPEMRRSNTWFRTYYAPITIQDGVWIGGGAIVLPGVTIGTCSVIGAGSVVTRSIPAHCVAVGNPCKPIRFLSPS